MAERYEDQYRRDRGYRPGDRGFIDRAGDEVRSWFGDDEAERRRQLDERNPYRSDSYRDRGYGSGDRPYGMYGDRPYSGYGDRPYGPSADRPYYGTYDDRSGWSRDRADAGYRPDGWRGMNYPSSQTYGNRDMAFRSDERSGPNFAGRGPRGYQRSDSRITEDVCDCLCDSPDIDARNIDVSVSNGEVTLNGSVSDRDQKRRAEDLIEHISGVRDVHNNLRTDTGSVAGQTNTTAPGAATGEQPGNVLGVTGGAPDRAATAGRR
jgi:osmotically-inducible protein OsmY